MANGVEAKDWCGNVLEKMGRSMRGTDQRAEDMPIVVIVGFK
jgi:hypothetical protein